MSDEERKIYITLGQAAQDTPYSQEYLSLLVRKGKLDGRKFGRNWYTTKIALQEYAARQQDWFLKKAHRESGRDDLPAVHGSPVSDAASEILSPTASRSPPHNPLAQFLEHIGREAIVVALTLALSVSVGAAGLHAVREWRNGHAGVVEDVSPRTMFEDAKAVFVRVGEALSADIESLASLADAPLRRFKYMGTSPRKRDSPALSSEPTAPQEFLSPDH